MAKSSWLTRLLKKVLPHKSIGWEEIDENFLRFTLLKTPWFRIYLHRLVAPIWHPHCHDHPWSFVTLLLWGGYEEMLKDGTIHWRRPGTVLYRPAEFVHNVITRPNSTAWSLVFTTAKKREWGFIECER